MSNRAGASSWKRAHPWKIDVGNQMEWESSGFSLLRLFSSWHAPLLQEHSGSGSAGADGLRGSGCCGSPQGVVIWGRVRLQCCRNSGWEGLRGRDASQAWHLLFNRQPSVSQAGIRVGTREPALLPSLWHPVPAGNTSAWNTSLTKFRGGDSSILNTEPQISWGVECKIDGYF